MDSFCNIQHVAIIPQNRGVGGWGVVVGGGGGGVGWGGGGGGGGCTKPIASVLIFTNRYPDSKFHGANLWPIWGRQDPGGPQVDPMNFAIWVVFREHRLTIEYYVFIWHFSCDDASQIWMWFEESSMNFCHIENFTEKLTWLACVMIIMIKCNMQTNENVAKHFHTSSVKI